MAPVLIVDDDEDVRFILVSCLEGRYDVLTATNAFEAMKVFRDNEISLVITDLRMPRADGAMLISVLREERPEVPIVAVTAYLDTMTQNKDRLLQQVDRLLEKPFMSREILDVMEKLIGPPPTPETPVSSALHEWRKLHQILRPGTSPPPERPGRPLRERLERAGRLVPLPGAELRRAG